MDGSEGFQDSDVSFRIVDQSRYPEILKLLYINFHTDEPMSKAVGIIENKDVRIPVLDKFALDGLKQVLLETYAAKTGLTFFYIVFLILMIMFFLCLYTQSRRFDNSKMINWVNLVQKLTKIQKNFVKPQFLKY